MDQSISPAANFGTNPGDSASQSNLENIIITDEMVASALEEMMRQVQTSHVSIPASHSWTRFHHGPPTASYPDLREEVGLLVPPSRPSDTTSVISTSSSLAPNSDPYEPPCLPLPNGVYLKSDGLAVRFRARCVGWECCRCGMYHGFPGGIPPPFHENVVGNHTCDSCKHDLCPDCLACNFKAENIFKWSFREDTLVSPVRLVVGYWDCCGGRTGPDDEVCGKINVLEEKLCLNCSHDRIECDRCWYINKWGEKLYIERGKRWARLIPWKRMTGQFGNM